MAVAFDKKGYAGATKEETHEAFIRSATILHAAGDASN